MALVLVYEYEYCTYQCASHVERYTYTSTSMSIAVLYAL